MPKTFKIHALMAGFSRESGGMFLAWLALPYPEHDAELRRFAEEFLLQPGTAHRDARGAVLAATRVRHLRHRLTAAFRHFVAAQELRAQPDLRAALWHVASQRQPLPYPDPAPQTHEALALQLLHDLQALHTRGEKADWLAATASLQRLHAEIGAHLAALDPDTQAQAVLPEPGSQSLRFLQHRLHLDEAITAASAYPLPSTELLESCLAQVARMVDQGTWLLHGILLPARFRRLATLLARHGHLDTLAAFQARWLRRLPPDTRPAMRSYCAALTALAAQQWDSAEAAFNQLLDQVHDPEFRLDIRVGLLQLYRSRASFMDNHLLPAQAEAIRQFLRRKRSTLDPEPYLQAVRHYLRRPGDN